MADAEAEVRMRGNHVVRMAVCALLLAACVEETDPTLQAETPGQAESAAPAGTDTQQPPLEPYTLEVRLGDGMITLPVTTAPAGTITFEVVNDGAQPHTFAVRAAGQEYRTEQIRPGESMLLTVELPAGSHDVYCAELEGGPHADMGERGTVVVS